jgi:hypothetical protein
MIYKKERGPVAFGPSSLGRKHYIGTAKLLLCHGGTLFLYTYE